MQNAVQCSRECRDQPHGLVTRKPHQGRFRHRGSRRHGLQGPPLRNERCSKQGLIRPSLYLRAGRPLSPSGTSLSVLPMAAGGRLRGEAGSCSRLWRKSGLPERRVATSGRCCVPASSSTCQTDAATDDTRCDATAATATSTASTAAPAAAPPTSAFAQSSKGDSATNRRGPPCATATRADTATARHYPCYLVLRVRRVTSVVHHGRGR